MSGGYRHCPPAPSPLCNYVFTLSFFLLNTFFYDSIFSSLSFLRTYRLNFHLRIFPPARAGQEETRRSAGGRPQPVSSEPQGARPRGGGSGLTARPGTQALPLGHGGAWRLLTLGAPVLPVSGAGGRRAAPGRRNTSTDGRPNSRFSPPRSPGGRRSEAGAGSPDTSLPPRVPTRSSLGVSVSPSPFLHGHQSHGPPPETSFYPLASAKAPSPTQYRSGVWGGQDSNIRIWGTQFSPRQEERRWPLSRRV